MRKTEMPLNKTKLDGNTYFVDDMGSPILMSQVENLTTSTQHFLSVPSGTTKRATNTMKSEIRTKLKETNTSKQGSYFCLEDKQTVRLSPSESPLAASMENTEAEMSYNASAQRNSSCDTLTGTHYSNSQAEVLAGAALVSMSTGAPSQNVDFIFPKILNLREEFACAKSFLIFSSGEDVVCSTPEIAMFLEASWYCDMQYIWDKVQQKSATTVLPVPTGVTVATNAVAQGRTTGLASTRGNASTKRSTAHAISASTATDTGESSASTVSARSLRLENTGSSTARTAIAPERRIKKDAQSMPTVLICTQESCRDVFRLDSTPFLYSLGLLKEIKSTNKKLAKLSKDIARTSLAYSVAYGASTEGAREGSGGKPGFQNPFAQPVDVYMKTIYTASEYENQIQISALLNPALTAKMNPLRLCLQKLFLYCLRKFIPLKYSRTDEFAQAYPEFQGRSASEMTLLRFTANWFDLAMYSLKSQNSKSFLTFFVPQLSEGFAIRYITGSGESQATADRVNIFRKEGGVQKQTRAPRNRGNTKGRKHDANLGFFDHDSDSSDVDSVFSSKTAGSGYVPHTASIERLGHEGNMESLHRKRRLESGATALTPAMVEDVCDAKAYNPLLEENIGNLVSGVELLAYATITSPLLVEIRHMRENRNVALSALSLPRPTAPSRDVSHYAATLHQLNQQPIGPFLKSSAWPRDDFECADRRPNRQNPSKRLERSYAAAHILKGFENNKRSQSWTSVGEKEYVAPATSAIGDPFAYCRGRLGPAAVVTSSESELSHGSESSGLSPELLDVAMRFEL